MRIYIGFDHREPQTYAVAESSLRRYASGPVDVIPLNAEKLAACGLLRRPMDTRGNRYDIYSNAYASTEFAISRFLTPILAQTGWALFIDADMVFTDDVAKIFAYADPRYAVQVVKHDHQPQEQVKMDGQKQYTYSRKNWSSVMLFNCDHSANKRLSLVDVQERPGRDLHQFYWLNDEEIGELPDGCNWLVNVQPRPDNLILAHFTLGTPEIGVYSPFDEIWHEHVWRAA